MKYAGNSQTYEDQVGIDRKPPVMANPMQTEADLKWARIPITGAQIKEVYDLKGGANSQMNLVKLPAGAVLIPHLVLIEGAQQAGLTELYLNAGKPAEESSDGNWKSPDFSIVVPFVDSYSHTSNPTHIVTEERPVILLEFDSGGAPDGTKGIVVNIPYLSPNAV